MSLRQAFRSKFRSENKDKEHSPSADSSRLGGAVADVRSSDSRTSSCSLDGSENGDIGNPKDEGSSMNQSQSSIADLDEQQLYELQLTQLQEQLVAAMIENQNLSSELKSYKDEHKVVQLIQDLEFQREKNKQLSEQIKEEKEIRRRESLSGQSPKGSMDLVDVAQEATEALRDPGSMSPSRSKDWHSRLQEWLLSTFYEYMADFTEDPEPEVVENPEGDPLTVKKLKDNIKRFKNGAKPIYNTAKGVRRIVTWKIPSLTLIIFIIFLYSVWHGWLLPVMLLVCILQLGLNFLSYRGWNINIAILGEAEEEEKESETFKDLGMSDKFNLVVQVARQVQNTLGKIADNLEKIRNLFLWKQPEATLRLFLSLCFALVLSSFMPGILLFKIATLGIGVKMFIIELIFHRFPRFKERHDSVAQLWRSLPTDAELERRYQRVYVDKKVLVTEELADSDLSGDDHMTELQRQFCELFQLPSAESPLPGWQQGRRCTLINKEKTLASAFKHGRLYLTRSFLCFERSRSATNKNFVIPLVEIARIEKAKPYAWMPGAGMSIEIVMNSQDKPYMFGALLNRDECFDAILACGLKANLPWATDIATSTSSPMLAPPTRLDRRASTPAFPVSRSEEDISDSQNRPS